MTILDFLWLFFMLSAIQPVIRQRMLVASRARMLAKIEQQRGSRVILMVHRQETMSLLGFPLFRYIDIDDSEAILRAIQLTDREVPLDLVLHTPGGLVLASLQIARAIHDHPAKVTVFVPHFAMSGGTLIALAADEIVMAPHAVLGPVDPQLGQEPAASVLKVLEKKPIERIDDATIVRADQAEKAIAQVERSVRGLLEKRLGAEKAQELGALLSRGTWTHDHPITAPEAVEMGLPVSTDLPDDIVRIMHLFPQPVRRQPSVEYLPGRRQANGQQAG